METIWNLGIAFIIWFQGWGNWLLAPMKFFTFLGSEEFFLVVLPLVYWCVDASLGLRIGAIVLFTGGINEVIKLSLHGPRPYWFSNQVQALASETSFGVPSGHAQVATGLWGMLAAQIKRPWAWPLAIFLICLIGISRLYLAVHFPHDVLLGWIIGFLILWVFLKAWEPVAAWAKKKLLGQQIGLALSASLIMLTLGFIALGSLRSWSMPAVWLANAQQAGAEILPAPVSLNNTITSAAVLFGMLSGLAWTNSRGGYSASGTFLQRAQRFLLGLLGLLIIYLGLRVLFPRGDDMLSYILRYVRFALIGVWISGGAPWLFKKLNLA